MKKVLLIVLTLTLMQSPAFSFNKKMEPTSNVEDPLPNIFIYKIPEDDTDTKDIPAPQNTDEIYVNDTDNKDSEEEVMLQLEDNSDDIKLGATTLKGYAEYIEDSDAIYLKDHNDDFVLNIKVPQKISTSKGLNLKDNKSPKKYTRYADSEYYIAPSSVRASETHGDFTIGALYGNEVDSIAMLESETGLFTKYEKSRFALSSTYKKNLNTTYNLFYDTISIAPEFKLNNYMSIKNEYKADITRNRKSGSLIFAINPFGAKDKDRFLLELGAKHTIFEDNVTTKTEFSFSTKLKL